MNPSASGRAKTGVMKTLSKWWSKQREIFLHDAANAAAAPGVFKPKICSILNLCMCAGAGQQAWFFHQNVVALLRPILRAKKKIKPPARILVDEARLIVKLSSSYSSSLPDDFDPCDATSEPAKIPAALWFHISYINLTSYHFTVMPLREISNRGANLRVPDDVALSSDVAAWKTFIDFGFSLGDALLRDLLLQACINLSMLELSTESTASW